MGKKDKKKAPKKKTILSLAEFNDATGGKPPELSALPSAPKAPEQWLDEGGKPEYNSRGYKERSNNPRNDFRRSRGVDSEYGGNGNNSFNDNGDDHSWERRGPIDNNQSSFGSQAEERDWSDMRRGPIDLNNDQQQQELNRDWGDMRRGPVDSSFNKFQDNDNSNIEKDWSQRKGPVEANNSNNSDNAWGSARGGNVIDAEFQSNNLNQERDWSQRKGPIEEITSSFGQDNNIDDEDWSSARKGPIESEFENKNNLSSSITPAENRNWNERKPVEAVIPTKEDINENEITNNDTFEDNDDWSERRGPVEAELPNNSNEQEIEKDWSGVRSGEGIGAVNNVENEDIKEENNDIVTGKPDTEDSWTRRGPVRSKAEEAEVRAANQEFRGGRGGRRSMRGSSRRYHNDEGDENIDGEGHEERGSGRWRRDDSGAASRGRRGRGGRPSSMEYHNNHHHTPDQSQQGQERDWGAARRSMPEGREAKEIASTVASEQEEHGVKDLNRDLQGDDGHSTVNQGYAEATQVEGAEEEEIPLSTPTNSSRGGATENDDEWTTVRANSKREARTARRSGGFGSGSANGSGSNSGRRDSNPKWRSGNNATGGSRRFGNRISGRGGRPNSFSRNYTSSEQGNNSEHLNQVDEGNVEPDRHSSPVTPILET